MTPEIKWSELLELAKEKGIDAVQLRWMIDVFKPESDAVEFLEWVDNRYGFSTEYDMLVNYDDLLSEEKFTT